MNWSGELSKFMTYDYWVENFKPIKNKISKYATDDLIHFETYDEEYEFVKSQPNQNVWTEVDGDSGTFIVAGKHWVNRIHYYVTENAWDDEYTEVPTWFYRDCECVDEMTNGILTYQGDPNPDCPTCDEGMIDISCETVENLRQIYGDKVEIVG